MRVYY